MGNVGVYGGVYVASICGVYDYVTSICNLGVYVASGGLGRLRGARLPALRVRVWICVSSSTSDAA